VCLVADGVGSLLAYDILCRTPDSCWPVRGRRGSGATLVDAGLSVDCVQSASDGCCSVDSTSEAAVTNQFEFDVSEFFILGSPLALVLAYRQLCAGQNSSGRQPAILASSSIIISSSSESESESKFLYSVLL